MFNINLLRLQIETLIREQPILQEDDQLRADMLDAETEINGAMTRLYRAVQADEDMVEVNEKRLADLKARQARLKHRAETLRDVMLTVLQTANLKKLVLPEATLTQRNGQPQIVGDVDADLLPDDLVRIKREANRTAIREALERGDEVPGLFLSNAPPSLTIHPK